MGRRRNTAIIAVVALLLALAVTGCADQTADANAAIGAANERMAAYAQGGVELRSLLADAEKLAMSSAEASKGVALTERMTEELDAQLAAAEAARAQLRKVDGMKVSGELKTYVAKEVAVTDSMLRQDPVARGIVEDMAKLYAMVASGTAKQEDVKAVGKRITERTSELATIEAQTARLEQEANAYFDEHRLSR